KLPRIFYVNWFRKDADGRIVWPGFGENSRVIKWIMERLEGRAEAVGTPIGNVPAPAGIDTEGLELSAEDLEFLLTVDTGTWKQEAALIPEFFKTFGDHLPAELWDEYEKLITRLGCSDRTDPPLSRGGPPGVGLPSAVRPRGVLRRGGAGACARRCAEDRARRPARGGGASPARRPRDCGAGRPPESGRAHV